MTEFDISNDGYTPDESLDRSHPYRPPYQQGAYRPPAMPEPYRPPRADDDPGLIPDDKPDDEPKRPATRPADRKKPQNTKPEPKEQDDDSEEIAREEAARERKRQRERRIKELRRQERGENPPAIVRFFIDERMRLFLAFLLMITSLFVVIAVFSHFKHGGNDQSAAVNLPLSTIAENKGIIGNAGGGVGAMLSQVLLCDALGIGSLMLVPYMWILALGLMKIRKCQFWATTFRCLLVAITVSIVLGLITFNWSTVVYWGGNHGHYINKWLLDNTTWIGACSVSVLLILAVCCVYLNELRKAYNKWREAYRRHKLQEELRRERRREMERLEEEAERERLAEEAQKQRAQDKDHADDKDKTDVPPVPSPHDDKNDDKQQLIIDNDPVIDFMPDDNDDIQGHDDSRDTADDDAVLIIDPVHTQGDTDDFTVLANEIELADNIDPNTPIGDMGAYDHREELARYQFPPIELLEDRPSGPVIDMEEQQANKALIEKTLLDYKIPISRIEATVGPTVTLYEIVPAEGVRISQIKRLEDDIALSLKALGIRIIAPIPGKGTVGIEVPNNDPQTVSMRSVISSKKYQECKMALPMAMGATISNDIFIADMAKMPHLLVAGATGMGKSVGLNAIITSLLYKKHPSEMKLVLVDPKMVEFSLYSKLERHYLAKLPNEEEAIITDMKKVIQTLNSLCVEMDNRYELLRDANVRSLEEYNKKFSSRRLDPSKGHKYLPYIVVIVDEFADLIMTQGKEVEQPIARIAQKARAVGIHMILATQRPSTNVITGLIKANFPGRIAFRVIQMVDSRTILDCPGANQLIGRGDMLFSHNGIMERVQCAFISTEEVEALTEHIDSQVGYEHAYYLPEFVPEEAEGVAIAGGSMERDSLFNEAARFVVTKQMGSTSSLQRQFGIGYNRAGKLMDQMEAAGIVGPVNGAKPRSILMDIVTLESILGD